MKFKGKFILTLSEYNQARDMAYGYRNLVREIRAALDSDSDYVRKADIEKILARHTEE